MNISNSNKVILTLDAGGTNFVFSALKSGKLITEPIRLNSHKNDIDKCLGSIFEGFTQVIKLINEKPEAISFAFPGPADYNNGVIGDLYNLPAFRGGVPLGAILEDKFNIPVFINNDGNLFTYGEAVAGFLPAVNSMLKENGSLKEYKNLVGITLGTGLGAGISINGDLLKGDNFAAGEIWSSTNKLHTNTIVEESISIRGVQRTFCKISGIDPDLSPSPEDIFFMATGKLKGNKEAAISAYNEFAEILGETILNIIGLIDGLVVIGGGLAGASTIFLQNIINNVNKTVNSFTGSEIKRLESKVYNLENKGEMELFLKDSNHKICVPDSLKTVDYNLHKKTGIGISKLGTNQAIMTGAYYYAINMLNKKNQVKINNKQNIKTNITP